MIYISTYLSPLGNSLLAADDIGLTGLWFEGQKYFANTLPDTRIVQETKILTEAKKWLDIYFSGEDPTFTPPSSSFRIRIQTGSMADFITDSLWADDHIWRDCTKSS